MPDYTVVLSKKAQKQLDKLSDKIADQFLRLSAGWKKTQDHKDTKN